MSETKNSRMSRSASSTRLAVLLLFLIVVGAGCIYEFAFARPKYQKAWDQIREVDKSSISSEYTSDQIEEMMGQEPFRIDDSLHEECVVHTYRWPSGLLIKSHDIHVVYTRFSDSLLDKRPELKGELHYYSAAAGQPLDLNTNFPQEKQTIVENLNAPMPVMGGGGGAGGGGGGGGGRPGGGGGGRQRPDDGKGKNAESNTSDQTESDSNDEAASDKNEDTGSDKKEDAGSDTKDEAASDTKEEAGSDKKEEAGSDAKDEAASDTKEEGSTNKDEAADDSKKSGDEKSGDEKSGDEKSGDEKSGDEKSGDEKSDG